jgi:hypothetical protein
MGAAQPVGVVVATTACGTQQSGSPVAQTRECGRPGRRIRHLAKNSDTNIDEEKASNDPIAPAKQTAPHLPRP